jgi:hypothetical protein
MRTCARQGLPASDGARPAQSRQARRARAPAAQPSRAAPPPLDDLQPWDAVEWRGGPGETPCLGRVLSTDAASDTVTVQPLVRLSDPGAVDGTAVAAWTADEGPPLTLQAKLCTVRLDLEYAQRADAERTHNPHGEHAIEVWLAWE